MQQIILALEPRVSARRMILLADPITLVLTFLSWHLVEKRALGIFRARGLAKRN